MEVTQGMRWVINVDGKIVVISRVIIEEIRACPTHTMGWFSPKLPRAWKMVFSLTLTSSTLGYLHLTDSAWGRMANPWWKFLSAGARGRKNLGLESHSSNVNEPSVI